jgi:hypothetical protein
MCGRRLQILDTRPKNRFETALSNYVDACLYLVCNDRSGRSDDGNTRARPESSRRDDVHGNRY